jgi:hypothetical protein
MCKSKKNRKHKEGDSYDCQAWRISKTFTKSDAKINKDMPVYIIILL